MDLRRQIRRFFYKRPRITGLLLLAVGIIASLDIYNIYRHGGYYSTREIGLGVIGVIYGPACLIEPRLLTAWDDEANPPHPVIFKVLSIVIAVVAAVAAVAVEEKMRQPGVGG